MPYTYFSIDFFSSTNDFGAGGLSDDILISQGDGMFGIFADGFIDIGLFNDDDLDALILADRCTFGQLDPGCDVALFSVSSFSPSAFTSTGNPYIPGVKEFLSPADILFTDFLTEFLPDQKFDLWAPAEAIGLFPDDEVDALDILPDGSGRPPVFPPPITVPEPSATLSLLVFGTLTAGSALKRKLKQKSPQKQTDKAA